MASLIVDREPIAIDRLPEQLQKHLKPGAPMPLKMMAASGMLPVGPDQQLAALYNLHGDSDAKVSEAVGKAIKDMPTNIIVPTVGKMAHPGVLDWLADARPKDEAILEAIIVNRAAHDHTIARLAENVSAKLVDIIATNQVRVLQAPVIIEQIYKNPNARMATVDRLIELAMREEIELKGIPGLNDAMKAGSDQLFGSKTEGDDLKDDDFASLLQSETAKAKVDEADAEKFEAMSPREQERYLQQQAEKEAEEELAKLPIFAQVEKMSISQKIRLATTGSREALNLLIRDPNKLVHNAAVKSPKVQIPDVAKWSKNKGLPDSVIGFIANHRPWLEKYEIKFNLVSNPKTPVGDALKLLNHIRTNDLKKVQSNRNVPGAISRQAKMLYRKRTGG